MHKVPVKQKHLEGTMAKYETEIHLVKNKL